MFHVEQSATKAAASARSSESKTPPPHPVDLRAHQRRHPSTVTNSRRSVFHCCCHLFDCPHGDRFESSLRGHLFHPPWPNLRLKSEGSNDFAQKCHLFRLRLGERHANSGQCHLDRQPRESRSASVVQQFCACTQPGGEVSCSKKTLAKVPLDDLVRAADCRQAYAGIPADAGDRGIRRPDSISESDSWIASKGAM